MKKDMYSISLSVEFCWRDRDGVIRHPKMHYKIHWARRSTTHPEIHCKIQWNWVPSRCCSRNAQPDALHIQKSTPFAPLSSSRWCFGLGYEFLHARHLDAHPEIHYQMYLDAVQFFVPLSFTRTPHWNYLEMTRKKLIIMKISNFLGLLKMVEFAAQRSKNN